MGPVGGILKDRPSTTYKLDYIFASGRPHAPTQIGNKAYTHDANGNQTSWTNLKNSQTRTLVWDDENRLMSSADQGETTRFKYDDSGERTYKIGKKGSTVYVNQFYVVRNENIVSKHLFAGKTRVATQLVGGLSNISNFKPKNPKSELNINANSGNEGKGKGQLNGKGKDKVNKGKSLGKGKQNSKGNQKEHSNNGKSLGKAKQNGNSSNGKKAEKGKGNEGKKAARQASGPNGKGKSDPDGNANNNNGKFADGSHPGQGLEHRSDRANEVANNACANKHLAPLHCFQDVANPDGTFNNESETSSLSSNQWSETGQNRTACRLKSLSQRLLNLVLPPRPPWFYRLRHR